MRFACSFVRTIAIVLACLIEVSKAHAQSTTTEFRHSPTGTNVPRKILALYDETDEPNIASTRIHKWLQTPLNHLGYVLTYSEVGQDLPKIQNDASYAAIVTWFSHPVTARDESYANWATSVARAGKKTIILGSIGVGYWSPAFKLFEPVLSLMGLRHTHEFVDLTHGTSTIRNSFSPQNPDPVVPPYPVIQANDKNLNILEELRTPIRYGGSPSVVVATGPGGGYAAAGFEIQQEMLINRTRWLLEPLSFLDSALGAPIWPRPDITTLGGRRIWINQACVDLTDFPVEEGRPRSLLSVLQDELGLTNSNTPITLFLSPELVTKATNNQAFERELHDLLQNPNIETALVFEETVPPNILEFFRRQLSDIQLKIIQLPPNGSNDQFKSDQKTQLIPLKLGDSYNPATYPTAADISPLTTPDVRGNRLNIGPNGGCMSSNDKLVRSDEMQTIRTYNDMTAAPLRMRATNIAFHISTFLDPETTREARRLVEKERSGSGFPIRTSAYVKMLSDFDDFVVESNEKHKWRIISRGSIQTVRFDHTDFEIDLLRSFGVIGKHVEGHTHYITLDPSVKEPVIVLGAGNIQKDAVGLEQSSWEVSGLNRRDCGWSYLTKGFGPGKFNWYGVKPGRYKLSATRKDTKPWVLAIESTENDHLNYEIPAIDDVLSINIECEDAKAD